MKMGYDDECFECYHGFQGNNPCENDGSHQETCLKCIHEICGSTSNRVISALQKFDWNCNGRCTQCDTVGITIEILLCDYHLKQRNCLDNPDIEYECYLCDYEGKCYYDENHILLNDDTYCNDCENQIQTFCNKRTRGTPRIWDGNGYIATCSRCKLVCGVEELSLCHHHIALIK